MRGRAVLALAAALLMMGCGRGGPSGSATTREQTLVDPPLDLAAQASAVLERDAARREQRFDDALHPGARFASTRIDEGEIERGAFSPARIYAVGRELFDLTFTRSEGFGDRDRSTVTRFQRGERGGPDAHSCTNCHWRGGPAGAGDAADDAYVGGDGETQASALARNPISLHGDGVVELLGREMTRTLAASRDALVAQAKMTGAPVRASLEAKGIRFGSLEVRADGGLDSSKVEGVDADLVVRPFGWKGTHATLRDAVESELSTHLGMQSSHLVASGDAPRLGPFGGADPDGDGVENEIGEGQVSALTLFVAMQGLPVVELPLPAEQVRAWEAGRERFGSLGCAACHRPEMPLETTTFELSSRAKDGASVRVDLAQGGAFPRISERDSRGFVVRLFSDLRRHAMGPALADPRPERGVAGDVFRTPPLWGLARSRPYLHDGRAPTIEAAILLHGGEAKASRDAFAALAEPERATVRVYLMALTRARTMVSP